MWTSPKLCCWVLLWLSISEPVVGIHRPPDCPPTVSPVPTETAVPSPSPSEAPTETQTPSITWSPTAKDTTPSAEPTESPAPSPSPSEAPTESPTPKPSMRPSSSPSSAPSEVPSSTPSLSMSPSSMPSLFPSSMPSSMPSLFPSSHPSTTPSAKPSASSQPSSAPSSHPTSSNAPSLAPTTSAKPSMSQMPSVAPTTSSAPSSVPSTIPSEDPSSSPSDWPSMLPSLSPSLSLQPSVSLAPSNVPSASPTMSPSRSKEPSSSPSSSSHPSASPSSSSMPSALPSAAPSLSQIPSAAPSLMPSTQPSISQLPTQSQSPTISLSPSDSPSAYPSSMPSASPTENPSQQPSVSALPTSNPSATPSGQPTDSSAPSGSPSKSPTRAPTGAPSSAPSESPSLLPSTPPTLSASPTVSSQPTLSIAPSNQPSISAAPSGFPSLYPSTEPSVEPSLSVFPSASPSNAPSRPPSVSPTNSPTATIEPSLNPSVSPSQSPSVGVREHIARVLVPLYDAPGMMDKETVLAFESAALRFLREMFPRISDISIDFTYVVVTGQTLVADQSKKADETSTNTGVRRLEDTQPVYELVVEFLVHADIYPGEPEDFNFQIFVASFFEMKYDDFLIILHSETDFFQIEAPQGGGGGSPNGSGGDDDLKNQSFFTLGILASLAGAALFVFMVGTLAVRTGRGGSTQTQYALSDLQSSASSCPSEPLFGCSISEEGQQSGISLENTTLDSRIGGYEYQLRKGKCRDLVLPVVNEDAVEEYGATRSSVASNNIYGSNLATASKNSPWAMSIFDSTITSVSGSSTDFDTLSPVQGSSSNSKPSLPYSRTSKKLQRGGDTEVALERTIPRREQNAHERAFEHDRISGISAPSMGPSHGEHSRVSGISTPSMGHSTVISDISPSIPTDSSAPHSGISSVFSAAISKASHQFSDAATAGRKVLETSFMHPLGTQKPGASVAQSTIATEEESGDKLAKWLTKTSDGDSVFAKTSIPPTGDKYIETNFERAADALYNEPLSTRATIGRIKPRVDTIEDIEPATQPSSGLGLWAGCGAFPDSLGSPEKDDPSKSTFDNRQHQEPSMKCLVDTDDEESTVPAKEQKATKPKSPSKNRLRNPTTATASANIGHHPMSPRLSVQLADFEDDDDDDAAALSPTSSAPTILSPANRSNNILSPQSKNPPMRTLLEKPLPLVIDSGSGDSLGNNKRDGVGEVYYNRTIQTESGDQPENNSQDSGKYTFTASTPKWVNWDTDHVIGTVRVMQIPKKPQVVEATNSSPFEISSFDIEATIPTEMESRLGGGDGDGGSRGETKEVVTSTRVDPPDGRMGGDKRLRYRRAKQALKVLLRQTADTTDPREGAVSVSDHHPPQDPSPRNKTTAPKSPGGSRLHINTRRSRLQRPSGSVDRETGTEVEWDSLRPAQLSPKPAAAVSISLSAAEKAGGKNPPGSYSKANPRYRLSPKKHTPFRQVQMGPAAPISPLGRSPKSLFNQGSSPKRSPDPPVAGGAGRTSRGLPLPKIIAPTSPSPE